MKDDLIISKHFMRTLGRLGIVSRSYYIMWGIDWVFPHGMPHGQGDKK